jgi:hypothetical protein
MRVTYFSNKTNTFTVVVSPEVEPLNVWIHSVIVITKDGMLSWWKNGVRVLAPMRFTPLMTPTTFTVNSIGGTGTIANAFQEGEIGLVRIYNAALSDREVLALYNAGNVPTSVIHSWNPGTLLLAHLSFFTKKISFSFFFFHLFVYFFYFSPMF